MTAVLLSVKRTPCSSSAKLPPSRDTVKMPSPPSPPSSAASMVLAMRTRAIFCRHEVNVQRVPVVQIDGVGEIKRRRAVAGQF